MVIGKLTRTKHAGVSRRESDGRYVVRATARACGKFIQRTEVQEPGCTLESARRRAEVLRQRVVDDATEIKASSAVPLPGHKSTSTIKPKVETLREYGLRWWRGKAARIRKGPADRYFDALSQKIWPRLGDYRVTDISRSTVESWVAWAERQRMANGKPYAQDTLVGWFRVLTRLLRDMAAEYDLPDPMRRVRPPESSRVNVQEKRVLTADELSRFLEAARTITPQHYVAFVTMATTGMRAAEVYALKWDAVDFTRDEIVVRRGQSGGRLVEATKTKVARIIPMNPLLTAALREHRKLQMELQHPGLHGNWVFPSDKGGMRLPQSATKAFNLATEKAKIDQRISPQVLRRTMNTMLIRAGVDRIVLRSVMGHVSEEMTERYAGVDSQDKREAILKVFPGTGKAATGGDGEDGE